MSDFINDNKPTWIYTMMIMQPELVTKDLVQVAINQVKDKKNLPAIDKIRFEPFQEDKCAQILHVGPFSEEGPTVEGTQSARYACFGPLAQRYVQRMKTIQGNYINFGEIYD